MSPARQDGPPTIQEVKGDVYVFVAKPDPEIPQGKHRVCPQCGRDAWRLSRHCWNCGYDFGGCQLSVRWFALAICILLLSAPLICLLRR